MDRGQSVRAGGWAVLLLASASLGACASLTTPKYAVREGAGASPVRPAPNATAHGTNAPYQVAGVWYVPHEQPNYDQTGIASWYGDAFQMKATADGEVFDMNQFSAAHTTLPLPSMVEVTNLDNGKKLTVRVNDRGPFVGGRLIDLSRAAAAELGYERAGTAHVRVRYVGPAPLAGPEAGVRYARLDRSPGPARVSMRRPADEEIFDEVDAAPAAALAAPGPLVAAPEAVSVSTLAPLPAAPARAAAVVPVSLPQPAAPTYRGSRDVYGPIQRPSASQVSVASAYRIQAGAFSDQDHARRAVAQLAQAGSASIEPMERGGTTLYRVTLPAPADEADAQALRDRVADIGFADARVVRP
jgi:rare lipoprotein A